MATAANPQHDPTASPRSPDAERATRPIRSHRARGLFLRALDGSSWIALRVVSDVVMLIAGCVVALMVAPGAGHTSWILVLFPPLTIVLLYSRGRYLRGVRDVVLDSIAPGFGAISIGTMVVFMLALSMTSDRDAVSSLMVWTWFASLTGVTLAGTALTAVHHAARKRRLLVTPTLIVGADSTGLDIAARLARHPEYGLGAVGFLDGERVDPPSNGAPPVLGDLEDLPQIATMRGVRHVIVGFPDAPYRAVLALVSRCDELGLETTVVPRLSNSMNYQTRFEYLGTQPLLNLRAIRPESWRFTIKHAIDRIVAAIALIVLSPLLGLIALAVRVSSPGRILFRQPRAGHDGKVFDLLKFRTMVEVEGDVDYAPDAGLAPGGVEGADRRTRVGRLLRRTSLDELPQLINVLRGEMSLVGPRPERPEFAELFRQELERYHDRHRVRCGITGWAQVHGSRGQTPLADRVELDNFYIEHWSLGLDVKILLLTIPALLRGS